MSTLSIKITQDLCILQSSPSPDGQCWVLLAKNILEDF